VWWQVTRAEVESLVVPEVLALLPRDFPNKNSVPGVPTKSVIVGGPQDAVDQVAVAADDAGEPSGSLDGKSTGTPSNYTRGKRGRFTKRTAGAAGEEDDNEEVDVEGTEGEDGGAEEGPDADKRQRVEVSVLGEAPVVPEVDETTAAAIRETFQLSDPSAGIGSEIVEPVKGGGGICCISVQPCWCWPPHRGVCWSQRQSTEAWKRSTQNSARTLLNFSKRSSNTCTRITSSK
jgi:hypothetical protein